MTNVDLIRFRHLLIRRLDEIDEILEVAEATAQGVTMVDPAVADLCKQFDVATSAVGARIQRVIEKGGLNADSKAALQAEVDGLTAMGKDPEEPIPQAA